MSTSKFVPLVAAALLAAVPLSAALASGDHAGWPDREETAAVLGAKTPLSAAVASAERETGGKAVEAAIERLKGQPAYKVEVAGAGGRQVVWIGAESGEVLKTLRADHEEGDRDGDRDGHEREDD